MKRLCSDPVAEILETVSPPIQRLWGFAPYIATIKVSKNTTIRPDYMSAAKALKEFTVAEMQTHLAVKSVHGIHTWISRARRKGLLSKRRIHSTVTVFIWIGDEND